MALYLLVGERFNLVSMAGAVTVVGSDPLYPPANLADGDPGVPYVASTPGPGHQIKIDGNLAQNSNGGFEGTWAPNPPGWTLVTTGSATATKETSIVHSGGGALKLQKSSAGDAAVAYADFQLPSGWAFGARVWSRSASGTGAVARIQNLDTGNQLNGLPDNWSPAGPGFLFSSFGSYLQEWLPPTGTGQPPILLEPYSVTKKDLTTIRVSFNLPAVFGGNGPVYFDDFEIFPAWDWFSMHRTNLPVATSLQIFTSPDNAAYTLRLSPAAGADFYELLPMQLARWTAINLIPLDLQAQGLTYREKPSIGELVLSQSRALLRATNGLKVTWSQPQSRQGRSGRYRFRETSRPHRVLELDFLHTPEVASFEQMRDDIYRRSGGGVFPVVFAWPKDNQDPTDTPTVDRENVVFGVLAEDLELGKGLLPHYNTVLRIEELPAPPNWYE